MSASRQQSLTATLLGIAALLMWASLVGVARGVREQMGVLPSAALANLVGGIVGLAIGPVRNGRLRHLLRLPPAYLFGCGSLFVLYNLCLYPAIDRAASHAQTVEVALINYLWPALSLALAVPILHKRASAWLWPGLLIATVGAGWAVSQGSVSLHSLRVGLGSNPLPYLLALVAAFSWALYSNLTRRWAAGVADSAAPLFLIATGIALALLHGCTASYVRLPLGFGALAQLAYFTLFPTLLAYVFWDVAMRKGNVVLVVTLSFFTPLLSTVISCLYLGVPMGRDLWIASALVIAGAMICQHSVRSGRAA
jgi:drug/metabolite transporter (DMT)-like permease